MRKLILLSIVALLSACSSTLPPAPVETRPPRTVAFETPCTVPRLVVPTAKPAPCSRNEAGGVCYDKENTAILKERMAAMEAWIALAQKRCQTQDATVRR